MVLEKDLSDMLANRSEVIITDYDNVLQWIDLAWSINIIVKEKIEYFSKVFDLSKLQNNIAQYKNDLIERDTYEIDKWLLRDKNYYPKEYEEAWMDLYTKDPIFYSKCSTTPMTVALKESLKQKFTKKLIILTHVPTGKKDKRKKHMIEFLFKNLTEKIEIVYLPKTKSKGKWIKENCKEFTMFIDDRFDIIKDVIKTTNCKEVSIFMPNFGYNKDYLKDQEFISSIYENQIEFATYNHVASLKKA